MGRNMGLIAPTPPRLAIIAHKCEPKLPHGMCGRFRDTKDPRLGRGADVAGLLPVAMSRHARGLAGRPGQLALRGVRATGGKPATRLAGHSASTVTIRIHQAADCSSAGS